MKSIKYLLAAFILSSTLFCSEHNETADIQLNNGQKWEVNEEMKPRIEAAHDRLTSFMQNGETDYSSLAGNLNQLNQDLIKSCTMTGAAHDELHKWLYPHMKLIDQLSKSESQEDSEMIIKDLERSFQMYYDYFE